MEARLGRVEVVDGGLAGDKAARDWGVLSTFHTHWGL